MAELLLELFSEEIPARMQSRASGRSRALARQCARRRGARIQGHQDLRHATPSDCRGRRPARALARHQRGAQRSARRCARGGDQRFPQGGGTLFGRPSREARRQEGRLLRGADREAGPCRPPRSSPKSCPRSSAASPGRNRCAGVRASFAGCARSTRSSACSTARSCEFEIDGIKSGKETRGHRFMAPSRLV